MNRRPGPHALVLVMVRGEDVGEASGRLQAHGGNHNLGYFLYRALEIARRSSKPGQTSAQTSKQYSRSTCHHRGNSQHYDGHSTSVEAVCAKVVLSRAALQAPVRGSPHQSEPSLVAQ